MTEGGGGLAEREGRHIHIAHVLLNGRMAEFMAVLNRVD